MKKEKTIKMKSRNNRVRALVLALVVGFVWFYLDLPALNLQEKSFYGFFFMLAFIYCVAFMIMEAGARIKIRSSNADYTPEENYGIIKEVFRTCKIPAMICVALIVFNVVGSLMSSVIFRSGSYTKLLGVKEGNFTEDVAEISFDSIPMLDKDSATRLAQRKLGELRDMVSQFEVVQDSTQINYQGTPVRVSMLRYGDTIKWLNNFRDGIPGYIITNMITQESKLVRLEDGIKYSPYDYFGRNLLRHLRFHYPTFMFDEEIFEIAEDGTPYWICPRVVKTIGLFGGKDVKGAVLVNAITGECKYYEEVPEWVDHVYNAELIMEQYDYYGLYQNGFLNSMFGQRGVTVTTNGYNYIAIGDDVYVYTGVTSMGSDESNIGFILTNQRTKDTKFYAIAGAEEFSACDSAEGVTQDLQYTATFPILLNIGGQPTYFMSLKDSASLVKMYAMVNVRQYQIVATGQTVIECQNNYEKLLLQNKIITEAEITTDGITGVISDIRSAVRGGTTYFYISLSDNPDIYYSISSESSEYAIIANVGDTVNISFDQSSAESDLIITGMSLEIVKKREPVINYTPKKEVPDAEITPVVPRSENMGEFEKAT